MTAPTISLFGYDVAAALKALDGIEFLPIDERVSAINAIRKKLHSLSPFDSEPVDFVEWVMAEDVVANDYNPNNVAPP